IMLLTAPPGARRPAAPAASGRAAVQTTSPAGYSTRSAAMDAMERPPQAPASPPAGNAAGATGAGDAHPTRGRPPGARSAPGGLAWVARSAAGVLPLLAIPDRSLAQLLDEAVRRFGARPAIEYYGTSITYAQLGSLSDRFAHALLQMGVRHGDRVSLCLANVPQ